jgi:hypothetical protein
VMIFDTKPFHREVSLLEQEFVNASARLCFA